jgi:hypothetical protein
LLAAILIAPLLAKFLKILPPYRREVDKPVLNALLIAVMLVFMVRAFPTSVDLQKSIDRDYPAEILPYFKSHPPSGPVLNYYEWGGYLGWSDRGFQDFVDSRVDLFEYAGVLKDYIDLLTIKHPIKILDKYRIRYVLFPLDQPLSYVLTRDPDWKVVYKGKISTMVERVSASPPVQATDPSSDEGTRP